MAVVHSPHQFSSLKLLPSHLTITRPAVLPSGRFPVDRKEYQWEGVIRDHEGFKILFPLISYSKLGLLKLHFYSISILLLFIVRAYRELEKPCLSMLGWPMATLLSLHPLPSTITISDLTRGNGLDSFYSDLYIACSSIARSFGCPSIFYSSFFFSISFTSPLPFHPFNNPNKSWKLFSSFCGHSSNPLSHLSPTPFPQTLKIMVLVTTSQC